MEARTSRGWSWATLFSKAIIHGEWEANAPLREAMAIKRERLRALKEKRAAKRAAKKDPMTTLIAGPGRTLDAAAAVLFHRWRSCPCDGGGIASFDRIRYRRHDAGVFIWAFDLIELDGDDLRRDPFDGAQGDARQPARRAAPGLRLNEHLEADGPHVFPHACNWALRASCRSGRTRATGPAARRTGSRARTQMRQQ